MLFSQHYIPLAERLRPKDITDVIGQDAILGEQGTLTPLLRNKQIPSMILWGPAGSGKTTIARLITQSIDADFETVSATLSGVADLRKIFTAAENNPRMTCLFVDEIHRFNKSQQDSFLPYVEKGAVILIGATTENPSFELNSALLSRCRVFTLQRLDTEACETLLQRAENYMQKPLPLQLQARENLCHMADGDGRYLLNLAESLYAANMTEDLSADELGKFLQKRMPLYDKSDDSHYNLTSALHKSLRASDCDAALYWLARQLDGGEDPLYILRRLYRFAYEDIGLADPQAVVQAKTAWEYYERIGSPEGEIACVYLVAYLATAPKSNAVYKAQKAAMKSAREFGSLMPPKHILNAPTQFMKEEGYGKGYQYDHDSDDGFSGQNCFPDDMQRQNYYQPVQRGFERDITKRLDYWDKLRQQKKQ